MAITTKQLEWMLLGVLGLLFLKYVVFGLRQWDATFHPGRTEPSNSAFMGGLL